MSSMDKLHKKLQSELVYDDVRKRMLDQEGILFAAIAAPDANQLNDLSRYVGKQTNEVLGSYIISRNGYKYFGYTKCYFLKEVSNYDSTWLVGKSGDAIGFLIIRQDDTEFPLHMGSTSELYNEPLMTFRDEKNYWSRIRSDDDVRNDVIAGKLRPTEGRTDILETRLWVPKDNHSAEDISQYPINLKLSGHARVPNIFRPPKNLREGPFYIPGENEKRFHYDFKRKVFPFHS
jgi:hypothetical protein